jgi:hypothetical protein
MACRASALVQAGAGVGAGIFTAGRRDEQLPTIYGRPADGADPQRQRHGVLGGLFKRAGHRVTTMNRL